MDDKEFIAKLEEQGGKKFTEEEIKEFEAMSDEEKKELAETVEGLTGLADVITNMSDEEKAGMKASIEEAQKMMEEGYEEDNEEDYDEDEVLKSFEEIKVEKKTFWGIIKSFFK